MKPFTLARPHSSDEAIQAFASHSDAAYIGGGTTLVDLMKESVMAPALLVDVNALPLNKIEEDGKKVRVGALVRNSDMADHPLIRERYPMLSEALLSGASQQLRNAATLGGNLLQRTRCYYFRDPASPCNKRDPNAGCAALQGYNRIHAVLGRSDHCIATHPSDMCVALAALDAVIHVRGAKGERAIAFDDFYLLPGQTPQRENVLEPGDLIESVELPELPFAAKSRYIKVRDRMSYEFALASAAAALDIKDGTIRDARLALGGVGTRPWRAHEAEKILKGAKPDTATFEKAADAELKSATPSHFNAFKIELAKRTIVRALSEVGRTA
jgi:xanthine dehydrogenase YagS FAD-binding subunit